MVVSRSARCVVAVVVLVAIVAVTPALVARAAPTVKSDAAHQVTLTDILGWCWGLLREFVQPASSDEVAEISPDGVAGSPPTADAGPGISPDG